MNVMNQDEFPRILLVDDDKDLLDLLKYNFEKDGYVVKTVSRAASAISFSREFRPHLIVLDIVMPDGDGIELCKKIRSHERFEGTYIFFLTARAESRYREAALEMGADDFIEKLSGLRALTNKVRAVLKNKFIIKKSIPSLSVSDLLIDRHAGFNEQSGLVYLRDKPIQLTGPEFEILFFLMQNPGKLVSRKSLIRIIWGSETFVHDSTVHGCIENLQRKVGRKRIETVSNDRYRLNEKVL